VLSEEVHCCVGPAGARTPIELGKCFKRTGATEVAKDISPRIVTPVTHVNGDAAYDAGVTMFFDVNIFAGTGAQDAEALRILAFSINSYKKKILDFAAQNNVPVVSQAGDRTSGIVLSLDGLSAGQYRTGAVLQKGNLQAALASGNPDDYMRLLNTSGPLSYGNAVSYGNGRTAGASARYAAARTHAL
jgi:hypothetical protein